MTHPDLRPIPHYGDLMSIDDFMEGCESGLFTDYDGTGWWATSDGYDALERVSPSFVLENVHGCVFPIWATHVLWCNK